MGETSGIIQTGSLIVEPGAGMSPDTSLNANRELGLIISSHAVMSAIASTFASDFRNGKHWAWAQASVAMARRNRSPS
jgi:hypothetical protein